MYFGDGVMEDGRDRWAVMVGGAINDWLDSKRINREPRKLTSPHQFAVLLTAKPSSTWLLAILLLLSSSVARLPLFTS